MQVAHQPHKQYATLWHAVTHGTMAQSSRLERLCTAPDPGQTLGTLGNSARSLQLALDFLGIQIGRFGDLQSLRLQCHKAMEHIWKHYETTLKQQRAIDSWYLLKHNDTIYIYNYIIERYSDTMCHVSHVSDRSSSTCIYSLNSSQVMKNNLRNTLREIRIGPNMTECIHLKKGEV